MTTYNCDIVQCDFLTLTTFTRPTFAHLYLNWSHAIERPARRLQYSGSMDVSGTFWGEGIQRMRDHYMMQASGSRAGVILSEVADRQPLTLPRCSRLDLQVTSEVDWRLDAAAVKKALGDWKKLLIWAGPSGDTIYIGDRSGEIYWRVYQKTEKLIRVEVELKRAYSRGIFAQMMTENHELVMASAFAELADRLYFEIFQIAEERGTSADYDLSYFLAVLGNAVGIARDMADGYQNPYLRQVDEESDPMQWIYHVVVPALRKRMSDHDLRGEVIETLEMLLQECRNQDAIDTLTETGPLYDAERHTAG